MKYFLVIIINLFAICNSFGETSLGNINEILKGTTIIISVQKNQIIIAADSKQTRGGDLLLNNSYVPLKCKIRNYGNLFFAAEGHLSMKSPDIDFLEIIESLDLSDKKSFIEKIDCIELELKNPVDRFATNFQKYNPISFNQILNRTLLSIMFLTFENNSPRSLALYWNIISTNNGWEVVSGRAESDLIPRHMIQGQNSAINKFLKEDPSSVDKLYNTSGVIELINLQIKETPDKVGGPIDIVVITPSGYNWIQRKEQCK